MEKWIGVDFDGTLARYDAWEGPLEFGDPIPRMVSRVHTWVKAGITVKIFTARVAQDQGGYTKEEIAEAIKDWCRTRINLELEVTCVKDFGCIEIWDDRAVQVRQNTGLSETELIMENLRTVLLRNPNVP